MHRGALPRSFRKLLAARGDRPPRIADGPAVRAARGILFGPGRSLDRGESAANLLGVILCVSFATCPHRLLSFFRPLAVLRDTEARADLHRASRVVRPVRDPGAARRSLAGAVAREFAHAHGAPARHGIHRRARTTAPPRGSAAVPQSHRRPGRPVTRGRRSRRLRAHCTIHRDRWATFPAADAATGMRAAPQCIHARVPGTSGLGSV